MPDNEFQSTTVPRAPVGSKRGWPPVTAQVPPDVARRLAAYAAREQKHKGDVVAEALEMYLDAKAA